MLSKRWDSRRKVGLIGGFQRLGAPRCQQNILNASDLRNAKLRLMRTVPPRFEAWCANDCWEIPVRYDHILPSNWINAMPVLVLAALPVVMWLGGAF